MCFGGGTPPSDMDAGSSADAGAPIAGCPLPNGHIRVTVRYQYGPDRPVLEQADVEVSGPGGGGTQQTGSDGTTTFRDLQPGSYTIRVTHSGTTDGNASVSVTSDTTTPAEVVVNPKGTLSVQVNDTDSNRVEGATVRIRGQSDRTTNAQGECQFTNLESGRYSVVASKNGYTTVTSNVDARFRPGGTVNATVTIQRITLEIIDRGTSAVISGTTQTKIVGQKVQIQVRTRPAGQSMTNIQWTIPGGNNDRVRNYTQSASTGARTDLSARDLQNANIDFYWISSGNRQVQVSANVAGASLNASVTFDVLAPTNISMTSVTGTVEVSNPGFPGSGLELHFGTNATPGISWTFSATAPAGGAGEIAGTQLDDTHRTRTTNAGVVETYSSGGSYMLDNTVPYDSSVPIAASASATWTSNDSPGTSLTSDYMSKTARANFRIYFMYKPSGADSIWVTLGRLDWNWAGETTRVGAPASTDNNWNPPTGVSNSNNPSGAASTELPTWTANVSGLTFR